MAGKHDNYSFPLVNVSVVVIRDPQGRILLDYNDNWGAFSLPMSKQHTLPPAVEHSMPEVEPPEKAACRAAAEVIGVPVDPKFIKPVEVEIEPYNQSGRDGQWKRYTYRVFTMTLKGTPHPMEGHVATWVEPAEIDQLEPISKTVKLILEKL